MAETRLISSILKELSENIEETDVELGDKVPEKNKKASAVFVGVLTEDGFLKSYSWTENDNVYDIIDILSNGFLNDISIFEIAKQLHYIRMQDEEAYKEVYEKLHATSFSNFAVLDNLLEEFDLQDYAEENGGEKMPIILEDHKATNNVC